MAKPVQLSMRFLVSLIPRVEMKSLTLITVLLLGVALAGAVEKRPLAKPKLDLCRNRPEHVRFGSHRYALSWLLESSEVGSGGRADWINSRNVCRERCMDTVAIETLAEWKMIINTIRKFPPPPLVLDEDEFEPETDEEKALSFWTSGHLCDFEGCEKAKYLQPININGWFWSSNNAKLSPTDCINGVGNCFHAWSETGKYGYPQPDNREFREEGIAGNEACLSVMKDAYKDGFRWHDRACYFRTLFICEDSDTILKYARRKFKAGIPE